jgi:hypothetical protein
MADDKRPGAVAGPLSIPADKDDDRAPARRARSAMTVASRVLAKCAANDPTVPKPNEATMLAWAEHIVDAGLQDDPELLLAAVTRVYSTVHSDGFRLRPWHVLDAARELREEAAMREPYAVRQAREDARDRVLAAAEADNERAAVADGMVPIPRGVSPLIVACRHAPCSAGVGRHCTTLGRRGEKVLSYSRAHPSRIERAAAELAHDSPHARQAAAAVARADALRALSRYRERHQQKSDAP